MENLASENYIWLDKCCLGRSMSNIVYNKFHGNSSDGIAWGRFWSEATKKTKRILYEGVFIYVATQHIFQNPNMKREKLPVKFEWIE